MSELKYQIGQQVKIIAGRFVGHTGEITRVDEGDPYLTYRVDLPDGRIQWYSGAMLEPDELFFLRKENERLRAFVDKMAFLSSNIQDSAHAFYRLEQIRIEVVEVQKVQQ